MDGLKLGAIVGPCGGPAGVTNLVSGDISVVGYDLISLAAVVGYPSRFMPAGKLYGFPIANRFANRARSEQTLLRIAQRFEQATQARQAPKYLPTVPMVNRG